TMPSYLAISPPPFLSYRPRDHLDPPSFPTRRSSDLQLRNAPPAGASLQAHEARVVVEYLDRVHRRKVDDDTAVVRRTAVQTMTATAHGDRQSGPAREDQRVSDLLRRARQKDQPRVVDRRVRRAQRCPTAVPRLDGTGAQGCRQVEPDHARLPSVAASTRAAPRAERNEATRSRTAGTTTSENNRSWSAASVIGQNTNVSKRSEEHTSELQSRENLVCRLLLEKKKKKNKAHTRK